MEQNQNTSLFGLTVDATSKSHLFDVARWAKFLAIVGFIMCAMTIIFGFYAGSFYSEMYSNSRYEGFDRDVKVDTKALGATLGVIYTIVAVLCFFPYLFLFQFASKMKSALLSNDQDTLNSSFQNLKKTFRYVGVLTIIGLSFFVVFILMTIALGSNVRPR